MTNNSKLDEVKSYRLEDWIKIFGEMYGNADSERDASSLWLDVIDESTTLARHVRRDEYHKTIETIPDVFSRLISFVAKYSINLSENVILDEGIDLRPDSNSNHYLTDWVLKKYPGVCSYCAQKPCVCHSQRHGQATRNEDRKYSDIIKTNLTKRRIWENEICGGIEKYNVETLFNMFDEIYSSVHHVLPISTLCFHFLEEVGEVSKLLLAFNNIQSSKTGSRDSGKRSVVYNLSSRRVEHEGSGDAHKKNIKYLNGQLKGEISDVVSWVMALINKVNSLFRATHTYYNIIIGQEKSGDIAYKQITLSELLFDRFYETQTNKFVCPYCKAEKCSLQCKHNRLIHEIENRVRREDDLIYEMRRATGQERRKCARKSTDDRSRLGNDDIYIVNISDNNMGFLSNTMLAVNDEREISIKQENLEECIKIRITRPAKADSKKTGYQYFHGAEIVGREKRSKQTPTPSTPRSTRKPARSTSP